MRLDYKTNTRFGLLNESGRTSEKSFFRRKKVAGPELMQGAIRIRPKPDRSRKTVYPLRRTAMIAAFFVFSALIATVSNGNVDDESNPNHLSMLGGAKTDHNSSADPDFYFIDSNQFVPGSARLKMAAYMPEENDQTIIAPGESAQMIPEQSAPASLTTEVPTQDIESEAQAEPEFYEQTVKVKNGDTLSEILVDNGVDTAELHTLLSNSYIKEHLSTLRINQQLNFRRYPDGRFASLSLRLGQEKKLVISRGDEGFAGSIIEMPLTRVPQSASTEIESSLFLAGQSAGLSQKTIMNLVDIFQWDVDFGLDIRKGDKFKVIYEKLYRDGEYLGEGDILAAEFQNAGRSIRAIRYTDFSGRTSYYTPEGRSMRKAFLRNPVDVVRITSHFNPNRRHPVLHTIRAHKGTDYGAPIGTPIRSSGDGKIIFAGNKGGYGKTIVIKHGDKYSTLYAHMSKFAKSSKTGKRVQQGQIIGYVGRSGRVTGPHLHYEFLVNGVHKNPLKVKFPDSQPLPDKYKADFLNQSRELLATLDGMAPTSVAMDAR